MGPIWVPYGVPFLFGAHLGPIWGPIFVWGPFGSHLGTHLEAEGRLNGGLGAEPPGMHAITAEPISIAAGMLRRASDTADFAAVPG